MKRFYCAICNLELHRDKPRGHPKYCEKHRQEVRHLQNIQTTRAYAKQKVQEVNLSLVLKAQEVH